MHRGSEEERWIVDPLDGTTNYAHGYPLFCISIAYERKGELVAGVVYAPLMGEYFAAELGSGARLNDAPVRVTTVEGEPPALTAGSILATNGPIHDELAAVLVASDHCGRRCQNAELEELPPRLPQISKEEFL